MRILAIRGENLASLAEPFAIDLADGPLADTGLFAITGDTGAGKSTILDALCLGLYGEYPRASDKSRGDSILDPSGHPILASDTGNILRRGAGRGFAEVDFIGQDGISYRATWEVRRARGRATGRLQPVQRKLERLDGSGAVATGIKEVLAAVEERTGLTFDQFRRTVLLAQGDFDAFLLATDTDRAELLEKITGTAIYSRISKRVFEEHRDRKAAVDVLRARREAVGIMAEEERAALALKLTEDADALRSGLARKAELEARARDASAIAEARANLAKAEADLARETAAWEVAAGMVDRASRLAAVAPLRPLADGLSRLSQEQAAAKAAAIEAEAALEASRQAVRVATEASAAREAALRAAESEVTRYEPEWREAAALDARITLAGSELAGAARLATEARKARAEAGERLEALTARLAALDREIARAEKELAATEPHRLLVEAGERVSRLFEDRARLLARLAEAEKALAAAETEGRGVTSRLTAADRDIAAMSDEHTKLTAKQEERRNAYGELRAAEAQSTDEALQAVEPLSLRALDAARRAAEAAAETEAARAAIAAAETATAEARTARNSAISRHAEAAAARAAVAGMADLAEATLSESAGRLRGLLRDGEACPVCGAADHPYAHRDDAAAAMARTIRAERQTIELRLADAEKSLDEATGRHVTAESRLEVARGALDTARRNAERAGSTLSALLPGLHDALAAASAAGAPLTGIPALPAPDTLAHLHQEITAARKSLQSTLRAAQTLRKELDVLAAERDRLDGQIREASATRDRDRAERDQLRERWLKASAEVTERKGQLPALDAEIAPLLAAADLSPDDLARDAATVRRQLEKLATRRQSLAAELATLGEQRATGNVESVRMASEHGAAIARAEEAERAEADRRQMLEDLSATRAGLLGGEATDVHRQRHVAARDATRTALEEALARKADLDRTAADRLAEHAAAARSAADAESRMTRAGAELAGAIASLGIRDDDARILLAVSSQDAAALAREVDRLKSALTLAGQTMATRRADLESRLAASPTAADIDPTALAAEIACEEARLDELRNALAAIRSRLDSDITERARVEAMAREIAAAEADLAVWQDVNAAIGQADGSRFRRFAQSVTLEQLVLLANEQLAALNPRYQLRRNQTTESGLALEVVDSDMGEEVRTPRSLSGGERFLVSLGLALALSGLEGRQSFVDTLFIDEGFGALDRDTLDIAIDALENLQGRGRKVGVITHVAAMIERILVQVRVEKRGGGRSVVRLADPRLADLTSGTARSTAG